MDCQSFSAQSNSRRSPGESPGTEPLADSLIPVNASAPALVIPPERFLSKLFLPCDFSSSQRPPLPPLLPSTHSFPPPASHRLSLPRCLWAAAAGAADRIALSGQFYHKLPAANKACGCNYYTGSQSHPGLHCFGGRGVAASGRESARDFGPSLGGVLMLFLLNCLTNRHATDRFICSILVVKHSICDCVRVPLLLYNLCNSIVVVCSFDCAYCTSDTFVHLFFSIIGRKKNRTCQYQSVQLWPLC